MFGSWDYTDNPLPMCEVDGSAISGPTSEEVDVRTHQMHDQADDFSEKLLLATNQMPLCGVDGLQLVEHELVVKTRSDINTRLVFDYLVFTTSSPGYASDRDPGTFTIDADDYTVEYSGEWQSSTGRTIEEVPNLYQNATMASTHNATVMLGFYGSQITMVGILDNTQGPPATGQYTIDGFFSTSFSLSNTVNSRATIFQQTIFTSYRLPLRSHEIVVRWDGDVGQQRLGFTNFYVETVDNPTLNGATTASTISPSSTQSSLTQTPQIHGTPAPVAVIVGGAVGGLVAVTAAIMFLWFLRRRRRITSTSHEHSQPAQVAGPHDDLQRPVQTDPLLGYGVDLFHPPAATPESVWTESSTSGAVTLSVGERPYKALWRFSRRSNLRQCGLVTGIPISPIQIWWSRIGRSS
ncbi:hypothetical protein BDZ89DRAFT_304862 [Hymenopellis radicata]|nr:hypothetical protein BDZ89DRAFT_304862 [Hymenopellis radicata]